MMWTVNIPDDSQRNQELITALTYRNNTLKYQLSAEEINKINEIYDEYHASKGIHTERMLGADLSEETKNAIKAAYSEVQISGRLSLLRSTLFLSAIKCPLCGIEATTDLDHYLPESVYKALAIYSRNLVPTCHKCNNKKRAAVAINDIGFIHCYYAEIPNERFFIAETNIIENSLSIIFKVIQSPSMTLNMFKSLEYQINRIELNARLKAESNDFLGGLYTAMEITYESLGVIGMKSFLIKTHQDYIIRFGLNHWKTALLLGLHDSDVFCDGGFIAALGH